MLILEIAAGFVLGTLIVRALPSLVNASLLIMLSVGGIVAVGLVGAFVFPLHERLLVLVAVLASYVVGGAALRTAEIRSRYATDELLLLGLGLLGVMVAGALLGYCLLAIVAGFGSPTVFALAFAGAVMVASAFGLIVVFME